MTRFLLLSLAAWAIAGLAAAQAAPDGATLYFQGKVNDAETAFAAALASPDETTAAKSDAARGLARIRWLVGADATGALAALDEAPSPDPEACRALLMRLRILREAGRLVEAADYGAAHGSACGAAGEAARLALELARTHLASARASTGDARRAAIAAASETIGRIDPDHAAAPDVQAIHLSLALDDEDSAAALDAWRGFFWLTGAHNAPQGLGVADDAVPAIFTAGLKSGAALADQLALERLLIRGGFFDQALAFDADRQLAARAQGAAEYRPVAAYFAMRSALAAATLAFNRATARGHGDGAAYRAQVTAILAKAAAQAAPSEADVAKALRGAYGYFGKLGDTGGYASLHAGHVVEDQQLVVIQGRRRGEVDFVAIDNMISNGFQSWLWDGLASTGGWADPGQIVQVRGAYTPGALMALDALAEAATPQGKAKAAAAEADDAKLAASGAVVFLPGLDARMLMQARQQIGAAARAAAPPAEFSRTFVRLYWDAVLQHSIQVHEGRHVLDRAEYAGLRSLSSPELEYRAKLSELEYADYPRLALASIFARNMGDGTPHGIANLRLITALRNWTAAQASDVAGYDPARPALAQLDKLTDAQLRAFATAADPENR